MPDPSAERTRYEAYSVDDDSYTAPVLVGTVGGPQAAPAPVFYDEDSGTLFEAEADEEDRTLVPVPGSERELQPGETVADLLEEIGDRTGWESLTEWARNHLEDE